MKAKHGGDTDGSIMCEKCDQVFANVVTLQRHVTTKHGEVLHEFRCEECGKVFSRKDPLTRHMKEQHWDHKVDWNRVQFSEELMLKCDQCNKLFKRKENLKVHKEMVHTSKKVEEHACLFCSKEFSTKSNCTRHQNQCKVKHEAKNIENEIE